LALWPERNALMKYFVCLMRQRTACHSVPQNMAADPLSSDLPKFPLIKNVQKKSQSNRSMHNNGCVFLLFRKTQKERCSIMPQHWKN